MVSRLEIEYDGGGFYGWARQPGRRTVQDELERALAVALGRPAALSVAGRTDRGVHAWRQVASYAGEPVRLSSLNALTGADLAVHRCERAGDGFDARRDALSRTYCYRLHQTRIRSVRHPRTALWCPSGLDLQALALRGRHDFTAFTPTETHHRRFDCDVFDARWRRNGELLELWIEAESFLRHMNRILLGTMLEVARGNRSVVEFVELLEGAPRSAAGPTAPAHGLALASVRY
jgi:tRNA pseudouridine38-40 synthase